MCEEKGMRSRLAEFAEHGVDGIERRVDLFPDLGRSENGTVSITFDAEGSVLAGVPARRRSLPTRKKWFYLCTREHDLAGHEDQQHDLRLDHAVNETREQLHNKVSDTG